MNRKAYAAAIACLVALQSAVAAATENRAIDDLAVRLITELETALSGSPKTVAVLALQNGTPATWADFRQVLEEQAEQHSGTLRFLSRKELESLWKQQAIQPRDLTDPGKLRQFGKASGVRFLLVGRKIETAPPGVECVSGFFAVIDTETLLVSWAGKFSGSGQDRLALAWKCWMDVPDRYDVCVTQVVSALDAQIKRRGRSRTLGLWPFPERGGQLRDGQRFSEALTIALVRAEQCRLTGRKTLFDAFDRDEAALMRKLRYDAMGLVKPWGADALLVPAITVDEDTRVVCELTALDLLNAKPFATARADTRTTPRGAWDFEVRVKHGFENSLGMEFVWIEALDLWVGKYEVTNDEFRKFKGSHDSGEVHRLSLNGERQPAVRVSCREAGAFSAWLTRREKAEKKLPRGTVYRLPTEREWLEFARCGAQTREYPWGDSWPPTRGNYGDATLAQATPGTEVIPGYDDGFAVTCPVDRSGANDWGLFGVGGNAWEISGDKTQGSHILKGASWAGVSRPLLRCEARSLAAEDARTPYDGFRLVLGKAP